MKILIVSQFYYPENFSTHTIAKSLVQLGHSVTVLTGQPNYGYGGNIAPGYEKIFSETIDGVNIKRVKLYPKKETKISIIRNYLSFHRNAKRYIRKLDKDFDVVYTFSLSPIISIAPAIKYGRKNKVKVCLHCFDLWPESAVSTGMVKRNSLFYRILYKWAKKLYEKCDEILISSPSFIDYFNDVIKLKKTNISYVNQPSIIEDNQTESFNYGGGFNVLYCGNIGKVQSLDVALEAIKRLSNHPEIQFHIVGEGIQKHTLQDFVRKKQLQSRIIFHGYKNSLEASKYIKGADVLYVSLNDNTVIGKTIPNKLIMYMSFGKPIIAALNGDGSLLLEKTGGGLITSLDSKSIAECFVTYKKLSKEKLHDIGNKNIDYYKKHLSQKVIIKEIENHLLALIK